jgi:hypothetical protein
MSKNDTDSDVSELDPKELSEVLSYDKYAPQLGYAEDPEFPLTADTFPSKSGGKPVSCKSCFPVVKGETTNISLYNNRLG